MDSIKNREEIIQKIKNLIKQKWYIYALCLILFEDQHEVVEYIDKVDLMQKISVKEFAFLLGFLIQDEIDFSIPDSPDKLIEMKVKTYELLEELHKTFLEVFVERLEKDMSKSPEKRMNKKDFFWSWEIMTEGIFYSGTNVFDFQYLEFLETIYKNDEKRLLNNKDLDLHNINNIINEIDNIRMKKSKKVNLNVKYHKQEIIDKCPQDEIDNFVKDFLPKLELYQYVELFFEDTILEDNQMHLTPREQWRNNFYNNLIDLFVIKISDLPTNLNTQSFFKNFSVSPKLGINSNFWDIGDFNIINSSPIIKLDEDKYFIPSSFLLTEAVYETPFYRMMQDKDYKDTFSINRWLVGENLTYNMLKKVFWEKNVFKSIKVQSLLTETSTKKIKDETDVDVLCLLWNKALCVQVKSKKLTELSKQGNDSQLQKDFKGAVQNAYEQGLICHKNILNKNCKFIQENGDELKLNNQIADCYIMCVVTNAYPSLTFQAHSMLEKNDNDPFPIVINLFDLDILTYYLQDPYDFLYYIRQRSDLAQYPLAQEEIEFLGYHLMRKLWKIENSDFLIIDPSFGQLISKNYIAHKLWMPLTDDDLKKQYCNPDREQLLNNIKKYPILETPDIIFTLLDISWDSRNDLINFIKTTIEKTKLDDKIHDFRLPYENFWITFMSFPSNNLEELRTKLDLIANKWKFQCKFSKWIGFWKLKDFSDDLVDMLWYNDSTYKYDEELDEFYKNSGCGIPIDLKTWLKIGRNKPCLCWSDKKYKNCCWKKE